MRGICGLLPCCQMAPRISAIGRGDARQRVVAPNMAQGASHRRVGIGQRETGCAVIEDSRSPSRNRVARCTLRRRDWESCRNVVRYVPAKRRGALESPLVTAVTIRRTQRVIVVHMARGTRRRRRGCMRSGQGKPGLAVIESCRRPTYRAMAYRTVPYRKLRTRCRVHRIIRILPSR
jgi:hypothetical protein